MAAARTPSLRTGSARNPNTYEPAVPDGSGEVRALTAVHRDRLQIFSHPTLKDKAAAYLRGEILVGHLRPGEKIDQEKVAETLGISRLPVREALIELTQENLVDSIPRRGCFVSRIDQDDIQDLYGIQGHVAGIAARRAAGLITDDQLRALRDIYRQFLKAKGNDNQGDISFAFFQLILDVGGSNRLRALIRRLYNSLPLDYFDHLPSLFDKTARYHRELLKALEQHDGDAAADVMGRFHDETGRLVIELLTKQGVWTDTSD